MTAGAVLALCGALLVHAFAVATDRVTDHLRVFLLAIGLVLLVAGSTLLVSHP